ncbi:hypothetical protein AcV5_001606 [Taiwanofungus camphoratus]|nr:hypothetical protein AcV5_001606 [Antrodia cinnamomea]
MLCDSLHHVISILHRNLASTAPAAARRGISTRIREPLDINVNLKIGTLQYRLHVSAEAYVRMINTPTLSPSYRTLCSRPYEHAEIYTYQPSSFTLKFKQTHSSF